MDLQSSMTRNLSPKAYARPRKEAVKTWMGNFPCSDLVFRWFPVVSPERLRSNQQFV
jgi:hypothetical protein